MNKLSNIFFPLLYSVIISLSTYLLIRANVSPDFGRRIFIILGGNFIEGGYIQFLTYLSFFLSYEIIKGKRHFIKEQMKLNAKIVLQQTERTVLLPNDVNNIRIKTEESPHFNSIINKIIVRACSKFRSSNSISEMMSMVSEQVETYSDHEFVEQGPVRFLNSAIPSLGFIGTIIGLSGAIKWANSGNMNVVTSELAVAFDTTLVALVLSLVINWYFSVLEKESDTFFLNVKHIITDRLINRIETDSLNGN